MQKANSTEEFVKESTNKVKNTIKNSMFDLIAVGLVVAMLMLNLGVLTLRDVTLESIIIILLECIPFFITSVLLSINYYNKGSFSGKKTKVFLDAISVYSTSVNTLTGKQIEALPEFCKHYNDTVVKNIQTNILKRAAVTFETFDEGIVDEENNKKSLPLKILDKKELLKLYSLERVKLILKAKNVKIKGLNTNILLGNTYDDDTTNLGLNEKQMHSYNTKTSAITFLASTLLMSFIGINNILQWGWAGLLLVAFKLIYILCSSVMKHFKGYNDITTGLVNHIMRKTDILKQFHSWYSEKYPNVV